MTKLVMQSEVLSFPRPNGVREAEERIAAQANDLREVRHDATTREHYVDQLERDCREQASVIAALQVEKTQRVPRVVRTYWLANQAHVTLGALVDAVILMELAGHSHPHFRPHLDSDGLLAGLSLVVMDAA